MAEAEFPALMKALWILVFCLALGTTHAALVSYHENDGERELIAHAVAEVYGWSISPVTGRSNFPTWGTGGWVLYEFIPFSQIRKDDYVLFWAKDDVLICHPVIHHTRSGWIARGTGNRQIDRERVSEANFFAIARMVFPETAPPRLAVRSLFSLGELPSPSTFESFATAPDESAIVLFARE